MFCLSVALVFLWLGSLAAYPPVGVPVQHGLFIPVNTTNNINSGNSYYNPPYNPSYAQQLPYRSFQQFGNSYSAKLQRNYNVTGSNELVFGSRTHDDETLLQTLVSKSYGFFSNVAVKEIIFPDPRSKQKINYITSIVVTDNSKNGEGGHTQILSGGVGKSFVKLRFKSLYQKNIDLGLKIFGYGNGKKK